MTVVTEVVIMTSFSEKHLNTLTTDQLSGQLFATLAMFFTSISTVKASTLSSPSLQVQDLNMLKLPYRFHLQRFSLFEDVHNKRKHLGYAFMPLET